MPDPPVGLGKALHADEWKDLHARRMLWRVNADGHVTVEEPATGHVTTGPTLKLAYDKVINR